MGNINNVVSLADICEVLQGKNVDKKKTNDQGEGLPIVVGASDLVQGRFVPKRWCKEKINAPVFSEEGDILISVVGTLGKMGINADGPACCLSTFAPYVPSKVCRANILWLLYHACYSMPYPIVQTMWCSAFKTRWMSMY